MESEMKKLLFVMALIVVLFTVISCGGNDSGKNAILDPYITQWGNPNTVNEEVYPNVTFYTYIWDNSKGHAQLVISNVKGKWEQVRFSSY